MGNNTDAIHTEPEQNTEKTYTQADIDASFEAGIKKANSDWSKSDEYKAFKTWQDNQKSEAEKLSAERAETARIKHENDIFKAEKKAFKAGAKSEFAEYVGEKVLAMDGDFDTNLAKYKKDYPQFFGETVIRRVSSSPQFDSGGKLSQNTNDIINNGLRTLFERGGK